TLSILLNLNSPFFPQPPCPGCTLGRNSSYIAKALRSNSSSSPFQLSNPLSITSLTRSYILPNLPLSPSSPPPIVLPLKTATLSSHPHPNPPTLPPLHPRPPPPPLLLLLPPLLRLLNLLENPDTPTLRHSTDSTNRLPDGQTTRP